MYPRSLSVRPSRLAVATLGFGLIVSVASAIVNGNFETAPPGGGPPGWVQLGGVIQNPPNLAGAGNWCARITDGAGVALGGGWIGAGIAQRTWCDRTNLNRNCYIRFDSWFDDPLNVGSIPFIAVNGPVGLRVAIVPDNDLGVVPPTAFQVVYPACGLITVMFGIVEPAAAFSSHWYVDNVRDKCDVVPWPGDAILPFIPPPTGPAASLTATLNQNAALARANSISIYDGSTESTSRGNIGVGTGRVIQCLPAYAADGSWALVGTRFVMQDQNSLTSENFTVEVLPDNGPGGPPDPLNPVLVLGPFASATTTTGGVAAFIYTVTFDPIEVPCGRNVYVSIRLPANPVWTADGLSIHNSSQNGAAGRERPKGDPNANMNFAWQEIGGVVNEPASERMWNIEFLVDNPALQPFAEQLAFTHATFGATAARRDFGQAGLFPDVGDLRAENRFDGLGWRLRSVLHTGTGLPAMLFLCPARLPGWIPIFNCSYLVVDPTFSISIPAGEVGGVYTWGPFFPGGFVGVALAAAGAELHAQAAVLDPAGVELSNYTRQKY